ncbi:ankyrin repeat domain-containing protein [Euzebyella saccharophila]|uniref:Ankyrin repeat domain-containing protein n=1 Tax=Euzebyella saccharophila TaxID=679664 RepID=A0ABV8JIQ9_9FLAO|nr:ankyrin repeat domain-containing protein [Euzebyella saccharophila]
MKTNLIKYSLFVLVIALVPLQLLAQRHSERSKNTFLNRDYWEGQPTISDIEANIKAGHSITEANGGGFDATTFAIFGNNPVSTIKYLVENGNDVNKTTHDSRTYIFWAASRGNLEVVEYLIENGAKMDVKDSHGYGPLSFTAATGQQDTKVYDLLMEGGADLTKEKDHHSKNALLVAIGRAKDLKLVDYFVSKGLDINSTDDHGNGVFHYASQGGNIAILKELKDRGVSITMNPETSENAIFFASKSREANIALFEYLESLGLKVNTTTKDGETPLHNLASSSDDTSLLDYFIKKGVDPNTVSKEGNTALTKAAQRNKLAVVKYFAEKSNNINHSNKEGKTALTIAVQNNTIDVVSYLIEKGADVNVLDEKGNTLAFYLFETRGMPRDFAKKVDALSKAGFDFKKLQGDDSSIWHLAVAKNNLELLKKIKDFGADINAKDKDGNAPIHYAAMKTTNADILKFLLDNGADAASTTEFGETAYDLASENELLAKNKVNIDFLN